MKKKCGKGKSCGASCIERDDDCYGGLSKLIGDALISLRENMSKILPSGKKAASISPAPKALSEQQQIDKLIKALNLGPSEKIKIGRNLKDLRSLANDRKRELWSEILEKRRIGGAKAKAQEKVLMDEHSAIKDALKGGAKPNANAPSVRTKGSRIKAKGFDDAFIAIKTIAGSATSFDWEGSIKGSIFGGKGAFGTVLLNKDTVVKRGEIGRNEAEILKKVGRLGLGPSLIFGELTNDRKSFGGFDAFIGRIAMTRVEGQALKKYNSATEKVGSTTVSDAYWKGRANLHRAGIAHNDAHGGNFYLDAKGVGKFIDYGLAQDNPKAALSEAIGGVMHSGRLPAGSTMDKRKVKNDYQAQSQQFNSNAGFSRARDRMSETLGKISDNLPKVESYLIKDLGLTPNQAASVMASGIRNPDVFYQHGVWAKVSDQDAKKMIDLLYDGV